MPEMKNDGWEYFMKEFDPSDSATVELWLNHQGISGWELVTVVTGLSGQRCIAFMKRPRWMKAEEALL
ncbi:hypothetical protein [Nitrospira sp. Nam74]